MTRLGPGSEPSDPEHGVKLDSVGSSGARLIVDAVEEADADQARLDSHRYRSRHRIDDPSPTVGS